jgi:uncharacterized DUF497 family protein
MYKYEWDEQKRIQNLEKHFIDFIDAIDIFNDMQRIEYEVKRNDELRFITIGSIQGVVILVIYTLRHHRIRRIISARRASKHEREAYNRF